MISCEEALQLVHDYLDGELERSSETSVKQHFDACERCYPHLNLESLFRDAVCRRFFLWGLSVAETPACKSIENLRT
jgi:anti-sigma factor (TIGR02949 family)